MRSQKIGFLGRRRWAGGEERMRLYTFLPEQAHRIRPTLTVFISNLSPVHPAESAGHNSATGGRPAFFFFFFSFFLYGALRNPSFGA